MTIIVGGEAVTTNSSGSFAFYRKGAPGPKPVHEKYEAIREAFLQDVNEGRSLHAQSIGRLNERILKSFGGAIRKKDVDPQDITDSQRLLTGFTVKYADAELCIHQEVMPAFRTDVRSGEYLTYLRGVELMQQADQSGGSGIRSQSDETADYDSKKESFVCKADDTQSRADKINVVATNTPVNVLFQLRERVDKKHARKKEQRAIALLANAANYNHSAGLVNTLLPGARWDEPDGDPATDINQMLPRLWRGEGATRLVAWCNVDVWTALKDNKKLRGRLGANFSGFITPEMFCELFGLDGLIVSDARVNTANQAKAASFDRLVPNVFGICRVSTTPQMNNASFAQRWRWVVPANRAMDGNEVNMWFNPEVGSYGSFFYKVADSEHGVIIAKDTGALFQNPLSTASQMP